jgi:ATP-binding cassette subfamily B protein
MLKLLMSYLKPYWVQVVAVLVFQALQTFCTLYLPNMSAHIIDNGVVKGDIGYIWNEGMWMLGFALVQIVCSVVATYFGVQAALSLGKDIRRDLYSHIQEFSTREVSKFGAPTLITRTTNDIQQVQQVTSFIFALIISSPIMFVGGIILSLEQDVALSGVIAVTFPVIVAIAAAFILVMMPYFRKFQKKVDRMNEVLREQISGVRVVRAFVNEDVEKKRFEKVNHQLYDLGVRTGRGMTMVFPLFMMVINMSMVAIMWFGGIRVNSGDMEIGAITAFITYMMYIMMAVLMSSMVFIMMPRAQVASKRILQVLNTVPSVADPQNPVTISNPQGVLEFRNVDFQYAGAQEPVLHNITFSAQPGQITAIIGSTGCGKSTLLRLIPRLFDATSGEVELDGVNIKNLTLEHLNSYIGIVPQKSFLFAGTVADNLRFGKEDATREEMIEALTIAQSLDFLKEKSVESTEQADGDEIDRVLNYQVSQGGTNFSGGQRQRLSIARAIIRKPLIYQFDDSFSALDYATDAALRTSLKPIIAHSTVIIVAQRVSTIRHADQIIVMDEGRIVGQGTHEQLLQNNLTYQEIVDSQLSAEEALK